MSLQIFIRAIKFTSIALFLQALLVPTASADWKIDVFSLNEDIDDGEFDINAITAMK